MADRHTLPYKARTVVARAALFTAAAFLAVPALATVTDEIPCPYTAEATLDVPAANFVTTIVITESVSANISATRDIEIETVSVSLLAPRAEAAIREAFSVSSKEQPALTTRVGLTEIAATPPMAGTEPQSKLPLKNGDELPPPATDMNTRLPGVSSDDLSRYKKQMYRRDI